MISVAFHDHILTLQYARFAEGGNLALYLILPNGELYAKCNINPYPSWQLDPDFIIVKDYSENVGMYDALVAADVIESEPERELQLSPFVRAKICRLVGGWKSLVARIEEDS